MSPTMTEGGIAGWRKKEGETFTAGDVLLEIVRFLYLSPKSYSARMGMEICQKSDLLDHVRRWE